jgi:hypothetical protein
MPLAWPIVAHASISDHIFACGGFVALLRHRQSAARLLDCKSSRSDL